jgi:hypothetical protein
VPADRGGDEVPGDASIPMICRRGDRAAAVSAPSPQPMSAIRRAPDWLSMLAMCG